MALTGKTIGELTYLSGVTSDTLFPVELSGDTYHIAYSAFTNSNYNTGTYDQLFSYSTGGTLTAGSFYLMTDFQTCYDQPNFDQDGNPITTGNYKTGSTESILLLATSTTGFSPTVFSTLYPKDKITYDITWNITEVTNSPAKGRITERIDDKNNRADYDFRAVQFIRYVGYFSEQYYPGEVTIDGAGQITGVGTIFTSSFSVGNIVGIYYDTAPISCFRYYEITQINTDTDMIVSGKTISTNSNTYYSNGNSLPDHSSPFQCNISGGTNDGFTEYYTFNSNSNSNTYIGNNENYSTFILSNNVFKSGSYNNNTLGGNCIGNTFDDDMDSNTFGAYSGFNILTNDFDRNTVESYFSYNIIDCDMEGNLIGENFRFNMIGDSDGQDFDYNRIGVGFQSNFLTMNNNDFWNNNIGYNFARNLIDNGFQDNIISGDFIDNYIIESSFNDNTIGNNFEGNIILTTFNSNNTGADFYSNNIWSQLYENTFGENVNTNNFGDPNNINLYSFVGNEVGGNFNNNYFSGNTQYNIIGHSCGSNNVDTNFSYNQIGFGFASNTIANDFGFGGGNYRGNIVGNGFIGNTIGEYCYNNTFGDECASNNLGDNFINNKVSYGFNNVTTIDLDTSGFCQNNIFTYGFFNFNLTLSGGTGGNPIFYTQITTNVARDAADNTGYVTFLSGGTIIAQTILV